MSPMPRGRRRCAPLLSAILLAAGPALAQVPCYESNLGATLTLTDDSVAQNQQLGFTFPGPGGVPTTAITICSNGFVWLTPNATATDCCNVSVANLLNAPARIAPLWVDLNPATTGAVRFATFPAAGGVPARAVVTWAGVPEFGQNNPVTVQLQLLADGSMVFDYESPLQLLAHAPLVGVTQGGNPAPVPFDFSSLIAGGAFDTGASATVHELFAALAFDLAGHAFAFTPNSRGGYLVTEIARCRLAGYLPFGRGCPSVPTLYEAFPPGGFDLAHQGLRFQPSGQGYAVTAMTTPPDLSVSHVVAVADDAVVRNLALGFAWPHPGGNTDHIDVSTNGCVYLVPGAIPDPRCCNGDVARFLAETPSIAALWQDLHPPGGGAVFFDVDAAGTRALVTWRDCPEYGNSAVLCTAQLVLEAGGAFELRYGTAQNALHTCLVGYTPGNGVADPGSFDFTTQLPFTTGGAGTPLLLRAAPGSRPVLGGTFALRVTGVPANAPLGFLALGNARLPAPLPLAAIGMPDCFRYTSLDGTLGFVPAGGIGAVGIGIPGDTTLAGLTLFAQAAVLAPGANALGMLATDAGVIAVGR